MGLVSILEDIEKRAEGASPTPTPTIEVKGLPYHSEQARLIRNAERGRAAKSSATGASSQIKARNKRKLSPTQKLEAENAKLRLKLKNLNRQFAILQSQLKIYMKNTAGVRPAREKLCLRTENISSSEAGNALHSAT